MKAVDQCPDMGINNEQEDTKRPLFPTLCAAKDSLWQGRCHDVAGKYESTFVAAASEKKKAELAETGQKMLPAPKLCNLEQRWGMRNFTPEAGGRPEDYVVTTAPRQLRSRRIPQPNRLQVKTLKMQEGKNAKEETVGETAGAKSLKLADRGAMDEFIVGPREGGHPPWEDDSPEGDTEDRGTYLADRMRNGERICRQWNAAWCTPDERDCPKHMRHCCSVVIMETGRVCGMYNHRACEHRWGPRGLQTGRRGRDRQHASRNMPRKQPPRQEATKADLSRTCKSWTSPWRRTTCRQQREQRSPTATPRGIRWGIAEFVPAPISRTGKSLKGSS